MRLSRARRHNAEMEIEFVIAAPSDLDLRGLEQVAAVRDAFARNPVSVTPAPGGSTGYWFTLAGVPKQADWPVAAHRMDAREAGDAYWLCADPLNLQLDRDRLLIDPADLADLDARAADTLIAALNAHFAGDGLVLSAVSPTAWVMRMPRALAVSAPAPGEAAGLPASAVLPTGADAAWVRRFSSEAQMLLHQAFQAESAKNPAFPPVNSLWIWGGGTRQVHAVAPTPQNRGLLSPQIHVRESFRDQFREVRPLPADWIDAWKSMQLAGLDKLLIDLTEISQLRDGMTILENRWLIPASSVARTEKLKFWVTLLAAGHALRTRLYRRDLFHFFGAKSLANYVHRLHNQEDR